MNETYGSDHAGSVITWSLRVPVHFRHESPTRGFNTQRVLAIIWVQPEAG